METTDAGKQSQQELLDEINEKIAAKKQEISKIESDISDVEDMLNADNPDSYTAQIRAVNQALALDNYFTDDEYAVLQEYFIEQDIPEETFVASDIDASISGSTSDLTSGSLSISDSAITQVDLTDQFGKDVYSAAGGTFELSGSQAITGDIIRATL